VQSPVRTLDRGAERDRLLRIYAETRARTESLAAGLTPEDQQVQSMPDASPAKWHRAHTAWFFETFVLEPAGIPPVDPRYAFLFNSYYEAVGPRHARASRGVLSRPTAEEVGTYRRLVDERVTEVLRNADAAALEGMLPVVELGIAHEEQHQELLLTDILHAFSLNALQPAYRSASPEAAPAPPADIAFVPFVGGLCDIGAPAGPGFVFDNERPRHREWVDPFALASRLVTMQELEAFLREDGYRTPSLWLAEGYDFIRANGITAPMHTELRDGALHVFTLAGPRIAHPAEAVAHVSYYEADAIARFLGARLPSEAEWEVAAAAAPVEGNLLETGLLHPRSAGPSQPGRASLHQLFGDVWEWTRSSYDPYPGYRPDGGALGEYNGKFMVNQRVLRGGSCLTPRRHVRGSYRNFWHAHTRFQMTGIRLAREVRG
jgi:ergothioneine biosynthesis protein EgtB